MKSGVFKRGMMLLVVMTMIATVFALPIEKGDEAVYGATKKYTIKYKVNGGTFKAKKYQNKKTVKKKIKKNKKLGTTPKVKRDKYAFLGWYTKKSGGKKVTKSTKVTKKMTLHARWTKKYTIKTELTSLLGKKYSSKSEFENEFPDYKQIDTFKDNYETIYMYENNQGKGIDLSLEKGAKLYYISFVSGSSKDFVNISKNTEYKRFSKKIGATWHQFEKKDKQLLLDRGKLFYGFETTKSGYVKANGFAYASTYVDVDDLK